MIAAIEITSELVPYILLAVAAIFLFGYFIGYKLGQIDGNTETARCVGTRDAGREPPMPNTKKNALEEVATADKGGAK